MQWLVFALFASTYGTPLEIMIILFIDFCSAFNLIQLHRVIKKLQGLQVPSPLIHCIYNFLSNRPQVNKPYHSAAQDRLPTKLSRAEPGQYLDGRPPGKTRLLLEEVLVRPAGGAHPAVCVGPNAPV